MTMRKTLLLILCCFALQVNAQYFRLTYYINGCAGNPLAGVSPVYLYAGAGTASPTSTYDYTAGIFVGDSLQMQDIGNNSWQICFDPYTIFHDNNGVLMPMGTTIY